MIRFALKGLLGRKLRTALTALAIVLGVAMISGTYVLTDSIDSAFDTIFTEVRQGLETRRHRQGGVRPLRRQRRDRAGVPESVCSTTVRGVDGVALAEGSVDSDSTTLIGRDGKAVVNGGAPNLGFAIARASRPSTRSPSSRADWPGPNEVVIDSGTAKDEKFKIGDVVGVQADGPVERLKVSGIVRLNASISIGGATLAGFDLPTAQRLFKKVGKLDEIAVAAASGTTDAQLVENIAACSRPGRRCERPGAGGGRRGRHERVHHLPAGLPARLRRHRALRRQLRDRELALDHDRAARARVRDRAHARAARAGRS